MEPQVASRKARKAQEAGLLDICEQLVALAKKAGASDSERGATTLCDVGNFTSNSDR